MINSDLAYFRIDSYENAIKHFFYMNKAYQEIMKKKFFNKDFLKNVYDLFLSHHIISLKKRHKHPGKKARQNAYAVEHFKRTLAGGSFHHIGAIMHRASFLHDETIQNFKKTVEYKFIELFYNDLLKHFYEQNPSFKLYSVFQEKNTTHKNEYYICIGGYNLNKCVSFSNAIDGEQYSGIDNYTPDSNDYCKFMNIGTYYVFVKFSVNKNHKPLIYHTENSVNKFDKPFPTNIIKVQFISNNDEINKRFDLVENVDFDI